MLTERIDNIGGKRILVAPLNWGLGHATRSSAIIHRLLELNKEVVIAADGIIADYFSQEFPQIKQITLPGINVRYSKGNSQTGAMLRQTPDFLNSIRKEHKKLNAVIKEYNIDTVISDNRFGLWSKKCYCIYITHQLMIKMPRHLRWAERAVWKLHKGFYSHYNEIWIPDFEDDNNLSGDLSHKYPTLQKCFYIGILSRFDFCKRYVHTTETPLTSNEKTKELSAVQTSFDNEAIASDVTKPTLRLFDSVVIVSGPEPQRSLMERYAKSRSRQSTLSGNGNTLISTLIVCGKPDSTGNREIQQTDSHTYCAPHLSPQEMAHYLLNAKEITCRSGYSTIMDLYALGILQDTNIRINFVPTAGQTEQEYLASYIKHKFDGNNGNRIIITTITK